MDAFLNTDGGTMFFGVDDDGVVVGLPFTRKEKDLLRLRVDAVIDKMRPQVDPDLWSLHFVEVVPNPDPALNAAVRAAAAATVAKARCYRSRSNSASAAAPPPSAAAEPPAEAAAAATTPTSEPQPKQRRRLSIIRPWQLQQVQQQQQQQQEELPASKRAVGTMAAESEKVAALVDGQKAKLYVVELNVLRGRAPIYFMGEKTKGTKAYVRLDGSVREMTHEMVEERKRLGRMATRSATIRTQSKAFIGREDEIAQIRAFVEESVRAHSAEPAGEEEEEEPVAVVLHGLPLVGKSSLAKQLVIELRDLFPDAHFEMSLAAPASAAASAALGTPVGLATTPPPKSEAEAAQERLAKQEQQRTRAADAMMMVIRVMHPTVPFPRSDLEMRGLYESCFARKRCILLIEDAESAEQVRDLLPSHARRCLVLVTSRVALGLELFVNSCLTIRLGALRPADAVELLESLVPYLAINHSSGTSSGTSQAAEQVERVVAKIKKRNKRNWKRWQNSSTSTTTTTAAASGSSSSAKPTSTKSSSSGGGSDSSSDSKMEALLGKLCAICGYMPLPIRMAAQLLNSAPDSPASTAESLVRQLEADPSRVGQLAEPLLLELSTSHDWHAFAVAAIPAAFDGSVAASVFGESYDEAQLSLSRLLSYSLLEFDPLAGLFYQSAMLRDFCAAQARARCAAKYRVWQQRLVQNLLGTLQLVNAALAGVAAGVPMNAEQSRYAQLLIGNQQLVRAGLDTAAELCAAVPDVGEPLRREYVAQLEQALPFMGLAAKAHLEWKAALASQHDAHDQKEPVPQPKPEQEHEQEHEQEQHQQGSPMEPQQHEDVPTEQESSH